VLQEPAGGDPAAIVSTAAPHPPPPPPPPPPNRPGPRSATPPGGGTRAPGARPPPHRVRPPAPPPPPPPSPARQTRRRPVRNADRGHPSSFVMLRVSQLGTWPTRAVLEVRFCFWRTRGGRGGEGGHVGGQCSARGAILHAVLLFTVTFLRKHLSLSTIYTLVVLVVITLWPMLYARLVHVTPPCLHCARCA